MLRRSFLRGAGLVAVAATVRNAWPMARPKVRFLHGVASGDPLQDSVILWTRVSSADAKPVEVEWRVAADESMRRVVAEGRVTTDESRDYTVKVDANGLELGSRYFYRFRCNGVDSPTGRTRTLPAGTVDAVALAVVSCSNHPAGYFHVYHEIARRDDIDAVLHLGDYLYEYGPGEYATENAEALGRVPDPPHEMVKLADYRRRHAQYKSDPDSQAMHASAPMIAVWDDHEITNDAWQNGAQNHQPDEGSWRERVHSALTAYFEWMPVRGEANGGETRTFRDYRFGDLATLIMLDTRLYRRDPQPTAGDDVTPESIGEALRDPDRRLLGAEQEAWLRDRLAVAAGTTWQVIGQQIKVAGMESPDLEPVVDPDGPSRFSKQQLIEIIDASKNHGPQFLDTWEGYPYAKADFLRDLDELGVNPVVLSGDLHTGLAADLAREPGADPVAVELMTPAVTSPGLSTYLPDRRPNGVRDATMQQNPHLRYMDIENRGWLEVALTRQRCTGTWHRVDNVIEREYSASVGQTLSVQAGRIRDGLA